MSDDTGKIQGVAWFLAGLGVGALIGVSFPPGRVHVFKPDGSNLFARDPAASKG